MFVVLILTKMRSKRTFNEKIYNKLKEVPFGKVVSYKILAESINSKAYRAVGSCMRRNKYPDKIPCFKVVRNDGDIGKYSLGIKEKIKRLNKEGIIVKNNKVDLDKFGYKF